MKSQKVIAIIVVIFAIITLVAAGYAVITSLDDNKNNDNIIQVLKSDSTGTKETPAVSPQDTNYDNEKITSPTPEPTLKPTPNSQIGNGRKIDINKPIIALSFDDGPSNNDSTVRILDVLKETNSTATFFVIGSMAEAHPETLVKIIETGCEIGNHTYSHSLRFKTASQSEIDGEVDKVNRIIENATGTSAKLVRPPWGSYGQDCLANAHYPYILWSIDTEDWKSRNTEAIFAEIKRTAKDGYIILMHDIYQTTADAVELAVPWLIEQGYQVVSVSELFATRGIVLEPGKVFRMALTNGETFSD